MTKKILILTASYGQAHNVIADTLNKYYIKKGYDTKILDLVNFTGKNAGQTTQDFYHKFCSKHPQVREKVFNILDNQKIKYIVYKILYLRYQKKFDNIIKEYNPTIVLSIFTFWGSFIKHNIDRYGKKYKTGIFITDSITIHSFRYLGGNYIDKYFLIDNYSRQEFIKRFNHNKDNLIVSFFPMEKKYFVDKSIIDNKKIYILLTGLEEEYISRILNYIKDKNYKITIIKGRNEDLYIKLKSQFDNNNIIFTKFVNLQKSYKDIGLFIGKAGGAIITECIGTDTPIIIPTYTLGQEKGNIKLIQKTNTGIYETDARKTIFLIKYLDWNKLIPNFKKVKKVNSCDIIFSELGN